MRGEAKQSPPYEVRTTSTTKQAIKWRLRSFCVTEPSITYPPWHFITRRLLQSHFSLCSNLPRNDVLLYCVIASHASECVVKRSNPLPTKCARQALPNKL